MKLAGRIGLVTGAQQGIGAAIAIALAEEGADVAITGSITSLQLNRSQLGSGKPVAAPILSARMSRGWPTSKQSLRIPSECLARPTS
jgi:NAD(P)-dependent dehydrogenase (short-subunit alcohol dehydrogenase family)